MSILTLSYFLNRSIKTMLEKNILRKGTSKMRVLEKKTNFRKNFQFLNHHSGQVIVEYILLLLVSSVMAMTLINFVSTKNENAIFFRYWKNLITVIAEDIST